jgi:hypothetical protein
MRPPAMFPSSAFDAQTKSRRMRVGTEGKAMQEPLRGRLRMRPLLVPPIVAVIAFYGRFIQNHAPAYEPFSCATSFWSAAIAGLTL